MLSLGGGKKCKQVPSNFIGYLFFQTKWPFHNNQQGGCHNIATKSKVIKISKVNTAWPINPDRCHKFCLPVGKTMTEPEEKNPATKYRNKKQE